MRTVKRNSTDVKAEIEHLWEDRNAYVRAQAKRWPTLAILTAVAEAHELTVDDLRSPSRARPVAMARHHACWELRRRRLDLALRQIAAELNRINHATALHSWRTFCRSVARGDCITERAAVTAKLGGDP